jgi:exopolyphosphatase/guanosine-5'-triphosphate,3'-diphosphate pyrophosphatase
MKLAALDLGSNSFHLLVAKALETQELRKIGSGKDVLRLGSVVQKHGKLTPEAFEAAFASVSRLAALARELGAEHLGVVATSALRDAKNGAAFLQACRDRLGVDVELLSGDEEARLVYSGALSAVPESRGRTLVADIGGGSLELAAGHATCEIASSLPLGFLRLSTAFSAKGAASVTPIAEHVRLACEKARFQLGRFDTLLLSGGTARAVGKLVGAGGAVSPILCAELARMSPAELLTLGVEEKRADTLGAGCAVLWGLLAAFGASDVRVSPGGLREGVVLREVGRRAAERTVGVESRLRARQTLRFGFAV